MNAAEFVAQAREFARHILPWDPQWKALEAVGLALSPPERKAAALALLPESNDLLLAATMVIEALESCEWTHAELQAVMDHFWKAGTWRWDVGFYFLKTRNARGVGALWRAIRKHEPDSRFPDLLLFFLATHLVRLMEPDPKSLREALLTATRYPEVLRRLFDWIAAEARIDGKAVLLQLLLSIYRRVGDNPEETARILAALLGAPDSKPPARWWHEWSATTGHWDGQMCRDFSEALWQIPMEHGVTVDALAHLLARAAIFGVTPYATPETCERLAALAAHWMLETPAGHESWNYGVSFAMAAIQVLGRVGAPGLPHLQTLARKVKHKNVRKAIDEAVGQVAASEAIDSETLLDLNVEDCGLNSQGRRTWLLGDCIATIAITERGRPQVTYASGGRSLSGPPKAVKETYAADLADIKKLAKRLQESCTTQRYRLEQALIHGRTWPVRYFERSFGTNPVLAHLARRMVWRAEAGGENRLVRPDESGAWLDAADAEVALPAETVLSLMHPAQVTPAELTAWQGHVVRHRLVQPTKQVFRETYVMTPAEEQTEFYSNRFAAQVVPHARLYALIRERGWSGLGYTGAEEPARRDYPGHGVRAHLTHAYSEINDTMNLMTIDRVSFVRLERQRGRLAEGAAIPLRDVPPVVFSETMRDVDLVVGVGSIGNDAFWADWEERRQENEALWARQRAAYEEQMAASAKSRADLFRELLPALGLGERARLEGHCVMVQGSLRLYRIHLGSGNIHMEPDGRYLCIVSARPRAEELYVPFEESDSKTAEILSKVLLLAEDDKISDHAIRRQLR